MNLADHVTWVMNAHTNHARKPSKAFRKWDTTQPYWMHPIWCAMTIATETKLDKEVREDGVLTLLYHDIIEDTTVSLPPGLSPKVCDLIAGMTFPSGSAQEMEELWNRRPQIRLYKLYDKLNNLVTAKVWMPADKYAKYREHTARLARDVMENYGDLQITGFAAAFLWG